MALVKKNRVLQWALTAEFTFNLTDTMVATDGVARAFGASGAAAIFDVVGLPPNSVVTGGDVTVETVSNDSGTATVKVGDTASDARYLSATSIKSAARTALVPTGFRGAGEDLRLTFANQNGDATAGKVTVRVTYIVSGRANETQIS